MKKHTNRMIGQTGVEVYPIGYGGMPISISGRPSEAEGMKVIEAAVEAGVNFIDTANVYCIDDDDIGHNERLIAKTLKKMGKTHQVQVATKGGLIRPKGDWLTDGRPAFLRKSCEESLKALETDSIFLYQLHAPADNTPFEESVAELARLKEEGKIQHVGLSNISIEELKSAQKIVRIESVQNRCHPFFARDYANGMLQVCEQMQVTYIPYSPVGGGRGHLSLGVHPLFQELAKKHDASPYRVALAWHLHQGPAVLPIPGASKVKNIQDSARAADLELKSADLDLIRSLQA